MIDDDFDFDDVDDLDDVDPMDDDETKIKQFGEKLFRRIMNQRYRLAKMRIKNETRRISGNNKASKIQAKKALKITTALTIVSVIYKYMEDHHIDKLNNEEKREIEQIAKARGLSSQTAKAISSMTSAQAAQALSNGSQLLRGIQ